MCGAAGKYLFAAEVTLADGTPITNAIKLSVTERRPVLVYLGRESLCRMLNNPR